MAQKATTRDGRPLVLNGKTAKGEDNYWAPFHNSKPATVKVRHEWAQDAAKAAASWKLYHAMSMEDATEAKLFDPSKQELIILSKYGTDVSFAIANGLPSKEGNGSKSTRKGATV